METKKTAEQTVLHEIMLGLGQRRDIKLFRNNTGMGWQGKRVNIPGKPNDVYLQDARPIHAGLCEGSSDLIGLTVMEITPEMIGQKVAVFTAIEVKAPGGRPTDPQKNFLEVVKNNGGFSGVARKTADALNIIDFTLQNNLIQTDEQE